MQRPGAVTNNCLLLVFSGSSQDGARLVDKSAVIGRL
jgi:hypothetical protein